MSVRASVNSRMRPERLRMRAAAPACTHQVCWEGPGSTGAGEGSHGGAGAYPRCKRTQAGGGPTVSSAALATAHAHARPFAHAQRTGAPGTCAHTRSLCTGSHCVRSRDTRSQCTRLGSRHRTQRQSYAEARSRPHVHTDHVHTDHVHTDH
eukprot:190793-Pleurochrysis_carterae.AAC.1